MMGKILFCATVDVHFKAFHLPYLKWFKDQGWEVHIAANGDMELPFVDKKYNIPIQRSPFRLQNGRAYRELKNIIEANKYQLIHCHTPMGGVLSRLAARRARKGGTKVIYTAHGFHFCKGAPLLNWLVYYPIEKGLAHYTDCLITINQEDYHLALRHRFKVKQIEHIHGVGVDTEYFKPAHEGTKRNLRFQWGYHPDDFLLFYAAELNKNKNQQLLIRALALLKDEIPQAKLLLAGEGLFTEKCKELAAQLGVEHRVHFLGQRDDIRSLLSLSDIAVASSLREGLPVNIMEAMACGLPIVSSKNRGHRELVKDGVNGYLIPSHDAQLFAYKLLELGHSKELRGKMGKESVDRMREFSFASVSKELRTIYGRYGLEVPNEAENQYHRSYL